jgi:hypothetical protein
LPKEAWYLFRSLTPALFWVTVLSATQILKQFLMDISMTKKFELLYRFSQSESIFTERLWSIRDCRLGPPWIEFYSNGRKQEQGRGRGGRGSYSIKKAKEEEDHTASKRPSLRRKRIKHQPGPGRGERGSHSINKAVEEEDHIASTRPEKRKRITEHRSRGWLKRRQQDVREYKSMQRGKIIMPMTITRDDKTEVSEAFRAQPTNNNQQYKLLTY